MCVSIHIDNEIGFTCVYDVVIPRCNTWRLVRDVRGLESDQEPPLGPPWVVRVRERHGIVHIRPTTHRGSPARLRGLGSLLLVPRSTCDPRDLGRGGWGDGDPCLLPDPLPPTPGTGLCRLLLQDYLSVPTSSPASSL